MQAVSPWLETRPPYWSNPFSPINSRTLPLSTLPFQAFCSMADSTGGLAAETRDLMLRLLDLQVGA